ncbi:prepilin peptidase [Pseudonocardia acaciae]|uniref:prepilin peptidase n=1 Tax=Pseudonocardia acaciae TaxID=551276 RepID=UPI0004909442|nr:A24 family peptidase [Pseudonocardia acaciae]
MAYVVVFGGLGMLAGSAARVLLGRLRRGARVPPPYLELAVGSVWAGAGGWWSVGGLAAAWLPLLLGVGWLAVAAGAVDIACRRLPDALTLPALPAAVLLAVPLGGAAVGRALAGAAVLLGAHLAVRLTAPAALGAGDVKLAAALGAVLGAVSWPALLVGTLLASALTSMVALAELLARRFRPAEPGGAGGVPHGPAMLAAGWLVVAVAATGGVGTGA